MTSYDHVHITLEFDYAIPVDREQRVQTYRTVGTQRIAKHIQDEIDNEPDVSVIDYYNDRIDGSVTVTVTEGAPDGPLRTTAEPEV